MPKIEPTDFQSSIYVDSSVPYNANLYYINSFYEKKYGITSGFLFMIILIEYFDIDPEPDTYIVLYCNNVSALRQVDTPLRKRGTLHRLIPEYNLVKELQKCIKKLRLVANPNHIKVHQDKGSPVDDLP